MQRRWTLPAVAALLAVSGAVFAFAGFRLLGLERQRIRSETRERADRALIVVARHARRVANAPSSPPSEQWALALPAKGDRPLGEGWSALFTAQAEHLEGAGGDLEAALSLYARVAEDATDDGWRHIAELRAGALAARVGRANESRRFLERAAHAPVTLLSPQGPRVRLVAYFLLAVLDPERVAPFLEAAGEGHRLTDPTTAGPDDLVLALEARLADPPPTAIEAAHRVRRGHEVLRALPGDGVVVLGDGRVARQDGRALEVRPAESLLDGVAVTEATAIRIVPVGTPREAGRSSLPLGHPLTGLEVRARAVEAEGGRGALLGLIAGLGVYVLGTLLALGAIHRSERAARMQTDFVAAVSHELKTPIASVRAMAEFLADCPATDEAKVHDYARRIEAEMRRLGSSVRNVLDAARIERQGHLPISMQPGEVDGVVAAVAQAFAPTLEARGFTFEVRVEPAGRATELDAAALQSALMNLIDNAAKFSADRREIEIEARPEASVYRIVVRDRGRGIDAGDPSRLFRRFARADAVRQDAVPGVGLGLFVVREVVQAHGGQVQARPRDGGGAEFSIELPLESEGGSEA